MSNQGIVNKDAEFGQLMNYAGQRSRSSAGEVWVRNPTLYRPSRNDSFAFKSILDAAGKFRQAEEGPAVVSLVWVKGSLFSHPEPCMSLLPANLQTILPETRRVAQAAFPKGNLYVRLRDELGPLYEDEAFADLFQSRGRPAESPGRLALITLFQFAEG